MAKFSRIVPQNYPRIQDADSPYYGCLDEATLAPHKHKIPPEQLKSLILSAINNANKKSSREILKIPAGASPNEVDHIYEREGRKLFAYFKKYVGDPASTAHQIHGKHYSEVGVEQFRNRTLQKERMNSGWRYQFLALDSAQQSKRFKSVSDIGAAEGDFNAVVEFVDRKREPLSLYVSVKISKQYDGRAGLAQSHSGIGNRRSQRQESNRLILLRVWHCNGSRHSIYQTRTEDQKSALREYGSVALRFLLAFLCQLFLRRDHGGCA
ncbi:MAG: hypothetical protein FJ030_13295 [Chloroflexi bacterium]|nr:hypothetical protein [Chloroflexota bacterium]